MHLAALGLVSARSTVGDSTSGATSAASGMTDHPARSPWNSATSLRSPDDNSVISETPRRGTAGAVFARRETGSRGIQRL